MEKVIVINRTEDLKYWNKEYSRLYFGNEFCPRLLPDRKEIEAVIEFVKDKKLKLSLLTPWLDSESLPSLKKIIRYAMSKKTLDEVVVNDYGLVHYLNRRYPSVEVVMGRAIAWSVPTLSRDSFFYKMGVRRIECDDIKEAISKKSVAKKISYYYPYSVISTSRYCPVAGIFQNKSENHGITKCFKECLKIGELKVRGSIFLKPGILKGNAHFLKNKVNSRTLDKKHIDRLIFQPHSPL